MADPNCRTCGGCGQIANDDDGTPWKYWAELPPPSNLAVQMGLVKPIPCPTCSTPAITEAGDGATRMNGEVGGIEKNWHLGRDNG